MQFMSQTPPLPTNVTELPKVAGTLLPGCEHKLLTTWWTRIGNLLQPHSQLVHGDADHCNAWQLF